MSHKTFTLMYGPQWEAMRVEDIHEKSSQISATALSLVAEYGPAFNRTVIHVLPVFDPPRVEGNPDLETLFGSLDLCACEEMSRGTAPPLTWLTSCTFWSNASSSHTTPTAKIVFKKTIGSGGQIVNDTAQHVMFARRPDIGNIALTCENTNTLVPYVDLVNEVLESAVRSRDFGLVLDYESDLNSNNLSPDLRERFSYEGFPLSDLAVASVVAPGRRWLINDTGWSYDIRERTNRLSVSPIPQTSASAEELATNPEHINSRAYDTLRAQVYPWSMPFDLGVEEARTYLEQLGATREEIMKTFQKRTEADNDPTNLAIACEYLGLTTVERQIITGSDFTPSRDLWDFWGYQQSDDQNWFRLFKTRAKVFGRIGFELSGIGRVARDEIHQSCWRDANCFR